MLTLLHQIFHKCENEEMNYLVIETLASLSTEDVGREIVACEWLDKICCDITSNNKIVQLSALTTMANITMNEIVTSRVGNSVIFTKTLRDFMRLYSERPLIDNNNWQLQLAILCVNLSRNEGSVGCHDMEANMWSLLIRLLRESSFHQVQYLAMHALANLIAYNPTEKRKFQLKEIIQSYVTTPRVLPPPEVLRMQWKLAKAVLHGPKYTMGIHLLHPNPHEQISDDSFLVDLIFIHGITGNAFGTWRSGSMESTVCWPRDWLPKDIPSARVISVGYDIFLSKWFGDALPIPEQSEKILRKLKLAAVGGHKRNSRPIIFVAHSFGGLIAKQLLIFAAKFPEYRNIWENTIGVVFFSTPHFGSKLTDYGKGYVDVLFRGTHAMTELSPNNNRLKELNDEFPKVVPHVSTLSLGEAITCFGAPLTHTVTCYQIVEDESANPKFPGEQHKFVKLNYNHRQVCKPTSPEDERYQLVLQFVREQLAKHRVIIQ
jgi:pimeloyl-ACP methyl ester carboxylesterase